MLVRRMLGTIAMPHDRHEDIVVDGLASNHEYSFQEGMILMALVSKDMWDDLYHPCAAKSPRGNDLRK